MSAPTKPSRRERPWFRRATVATKAMSMAMTLMERVMPSEAPVQMASMPLTLFFSTCAGAP